MKRTDLEAWAGVKGTGLLFSGYYAAMDQVSKMGRAEVGASETGQTKSRK